MRFVEYLRQDPSFPKELINQYNQQERTEKLKILRVINNLVTRQQKQGIFIEPVVKVTMATLENRKTSQNLRQKDAEASFPTEQSPRNIAQSSHYIRSQ